MGTLDSLWANPRFRRLTVEVAVGALIFLFLAYAVEEIRNLDLGLDFLDAPAGFSISPHWIISYESTDSRLDAYYAGIVNTLVLVVVGILLATMLGVAAGVARLSGNWLLRTLAMLYVEIIRNTPLPVQVIFWYTAVYLPLPRIDESLDLFGSFFLSNRGLVLPWPDPRGLFGVWLAVLAAALVVAAVVRWRRNRIEEETGQPKRPNLTAIGVFLGLAVVGYLATGLPATLNTPDVVTTDRGISSYTGGLEIPPEFAAILSALVIYTGAFIAEIVRGSIQSLPKGQAEAARAIGLTGYQQTTLVILPQALRIIIPPLTNQYLNLTKNSSLAILIAYPEILGIGRTFVNNIGHAIPMFTVVLLTYVALSLLISVVMNMVNRRVTLVER